MRKPTQALEDLTAAGCQGATSMDDVNGAGRSLSSRVSRISERAGPAVMHSSAPPAMRQSWSGFAQYSGPAHGRSGVRSNALANCAPAGLVTPHDSISVNIRIAARRFMGFSAISVEESAIICASLEGLRRSLPGQVQP